MDMILTGRPVDAEEALTWGLANRVVANGQSRIEAEKLAREIATFPQNCMRNDRLSVYSQMGLSIDNAMIKEFELGLKTLESGEYLQGSKTFIEGKGKHGNFNNI
jgi:enoyl-CoA hydratase